MPWTPEEAKKHKADMTDAEADLWCEVANPALASCKKRKGKDCEASAIRQANAVVNRARQKEARGEGMGVGGDRQGDGGADLCECPDCGKTVKHEKGTPCSEMECPDCGAKMTGTDTAYETWFNALEEGEQELIEDHLHGLTSSLRKERTARKEAERRLREVTKTDDGESYTASDYVYVPEPDKPSTWKLRISEYVGGKKQKTAKMIGAAISALSPGGHRGKQAQIPSDDLPAVKSKLRGLWKKYNPDRDPDEMPSHIKESGMWAEDLRELLKAALIDEAPPVAPRSYRYWIKDVSVDENRFVYEDEEEGGTYQRSYTLQPGGGVSLSPAEEVRVSTTYTIVGEAAGDELFGDVIPLVEKAVDDKGTIPIKIIQPGWGTMGYYGPDLLERDGPKVFGKGTQMFWDHPTLTEEAERPERSLRDLAGELVEDAHYDAHGYDGAGLYARAKVFEPFKDSVDALASHIGLSINARGRAKEGEAEGKEGAIIQEISGARSVDFVTVPGAGGQILELFEAARGRPPKNSEPGGDDMAIEQELKEAKDALAKEKAAREKLETDNARLLEVVLLGKAKDFVGEKLAEQDIPEMTKVRLIETLSKDPPVKDGELDEEKLTEIVENGVKTEMAYLAELTSSGQIKGLGETETAEPDEKDEAKLIESWKEHYLSQGKPEELAEQMAKISAKGR